MTCARALAVAAVLATTAGPATGSRPVRFIADDHTIRIELRGKPFAVYRLAESDGSPLVRPFLFPVLAADGTPVTADQTVNRGDHPHHRSLWVGHGDVGGADHWETARADPGVPRQAPVGRPLIEGDALVHELDWLDAAGDATVRERRRLRFFEYPNGDRGIDLTSVYSASEGPVTLGDTKEAGLCALRVAKAISDDPLILNAAGGEGEPACWGRPAEWCAVSGMIGGRSYGVAVLDHPGNPRHPSRWHVRRYGLLAANVFGLSAFERGDAGISGALDLEPGRPLAFSYRVVVHRGRGRDAGLDAKFAEFAGSAGPGMRPLFNGRTLDGWRVPDPNPWWAVVDGVLRGRADPERRGHELYTIQEFQDVIVEAEFRFAGEIDSGIFLRRNEKLQVQIGVSRSLGRDMTCSIYAGGYPGRAEGVAKLLREGAWNRIRVVALGDRYRIWLNGVQVLDWSDPRFKDPGPIGLQIHGGMDMVVEFRNLIVNEPVR